MAVNPHIVCINYQDYQKDKKKMIAEQTGSDQDTGNAKRLICIELTWLRFTDIISFTTLVKAVV